MSERFSALVLDEIDGKVTSSLKELSVDDLPEGDVTVAVEYSDLNYKDGLVLAGIGRLVKKYPHVPGIDLAGTVEESSDGRYRPGDKVLLTGWRVGELHWGGYAQKARVKGDWLVPLPDRLTSAEAMAVGTAGFTAMLCVEALEAHDVTPEKGEVLVTGAAGGVGSIAVAILAKLGYPVVASTGRGELVDYLTELGASEIMDRAELADYTGKPLLSERWAGGIDTVGGTTLAKALTQVRYHGAIAACGNAGGMELPTNVAPFILRGVSLLGIDSAMLPGPERRRIWKRVVTDLPLEKLEAITTVVALSEVPVLGRRILEGGVRGRTVVDVNRA
ncbi:MAG: MDR family oxidoreductase [Alphaproteobacteria bacterium]